MRLKFNMRKDDEIRLRHMLDAAGVKPIWLRRRPEAELGRHKPAHTIDTLSQLLRFV